MLLILYTGTIYSTILILLYCTLWLVTLTSYSHMEHVLMLYCYTIYNTRYTIPPPPPPQGTPSYMAPELIADTKTTRATPFSCDIYSFGMCMWSCIMRQRPYSDEKHSKVASGKW